MKKLLILSLLLLSGCRVVTVSWPSGAKVQVSTFGMDTKIGGFEGKLQDGTSVRFNDLASNPNEAVMVKLIDKIPSPIVVPVP